MMMTNNHQSLPVHDVISSLRKSNQTKLEVFDLVTQNDRKDFIRYLEKLMRKGVVSIIVVEGDRK